MARPTLIESALRHERTALVVTLLVIPVVCWAWIVVMARDMHGAMDGPTAWMMTPAWDASHLILLWAMWAVMMAGMMLPSAAPILLLYARAARNRDGAKGVGRVYALAAGYLSVWVLFSVGATLLQRGLATSLLLTPMMEPATPLVGAVVLVIAGLYQLTPLKRVCLQSCRAPVAFLTRHWRSGAGGAFRMGLEHGVYCLGCCWALMLVLFAGGVMNLTVILALTAWVVIEKIAPFGERTPVASGILMLGVAGWVLLA